MQTYKGGCHCGAVQYEIQSEAITAALECNCSHCGIKGMRLAFYPRSQFTLHTGEDNLTEYLFNKKVIHHLFCKTCGVQSFAYGKDENGGDTVAINVRTIPDIDQEALTINKFNGRDY